MKARQVVTIADFLAFEEHLMYRALDRNMALEVFLRSLWKAMLINAEKELTYRLFAEMLYASAVLIPPLDFDESWRIYTKWPDFNAATDGFELAKAMILFQIADLRRISEIFATGDKARIKEIDAYYEKEWVNGPDAGSFLRTGFRYMHDVRIAPDTPCNWFFLPSFLRAGQKYE